MTTLTLYISPEAEARLRLAAEETGRTCEDLGECALSEYLLDQFRHRKDDPGRNAPRYVMPSPTDLHA